MKKTKRKSLSKRLSENIFNRIHQDMGSASMCWSKIKKAGIFDAKKAGEIAFELCHFIADEMDKVNWEKHLKEELEKKLDKV